MADDDKKGIASSEMVSAPVVRRPPREEPYVSTPQLGDEEPYAPPAYYVNPADGPSGPGGSGPIASAPVVRRYYVPPPEGPREEQYAPPPAGTYVPPPADMNDWSPQNWAESGLAYAPPPIGPQPPDPQVNSMSRAMAALPQQAPTARVPLPQPTFVDTLRQIPSVFASNAKRNTAIMSTPRDQQVVEPGQVVLPPAPPPRPDPRAVERYLASLAPRR